MDKINAIHRARIYVNKIKDLEDKIHIYEVDIVKIALEVCDIKRGGCAHHLYTIRDFAKDIGMNSKTLQNWVSAYRNVVPKLKSPDIITKKDWSSVRKTNRMTSSSNTREEVQEVYRKYQEEEKPFIGEFRNTVCAAKNLRHLLRNRDMKIIDNNKWIELMEILDNNSDSINDYLTRNR